MKKSLPVALFVLFGAVGCGQGDEQNAPTDVAEESAENAPTDDVGTSEQGINYAPACISRTISYDYSYYAVSRLPKVHVTIRNGCGKFMRVKVIIDSGFDSSCKGMYANTSMTWSVLGYYDYTITC